MSEITDVLPPGQLWGLDPVFRSHAKLYIRDLVSLKPIDGHQGIFQYRSHPIVRVDVLGVVVRSEERTKFSCYTLDDGTGVISCTVWKPGESDARAMQSGISACVDDPNKETERMFLLPKLYRDCYDKAATLPSSIADAISVGGTEKITLVYDVETAIVSYCNKIHIREVTKDDILDIEAVRNHLGNHINCSDILDQALNNLVKGGHIFEKPISSACSGNTNQSFLVTSECLQLEEAVVTVIKNWSEAGNQLSTGDEGCPADHIYTMIHKQAQFATLECSALYQCLEKLEGQSDIISTAEKRYVTFNDSL